MKITKDQIKNWVDSKSFERGVKYFKDGKVFDTVVIGNTIQGKSQGSSYNEYSLAVTIENNQIMNALCSCPIGEDGRCKHIVAFLMEWVEKPDDFVDVLKTLAPLKSLSKAKLIDIIIDLVKFYNQNFSYVENLLISEIAFENNEDLFKKFRHNIQSTIPSVKDKIYDDMDILTLLEPHLQTIGKLVYDQKIEFALCKCLAIIDYLSEIYTMNIHDFDGEVAIIVDELTMKIIEMLKKNKGLTDYVTIVSEVLLRTLTTHIQIGQEEYGQEARNYIVNLYKQNPDKHNEIIQQLQADIEIMKGNKKLKWEVETNKFLLYQITNMS